MVLDVLIFGAAADAAGRDRVQVSLPRDQRATVRDVLVAMEQQHPRLGFAVRGARLAVNHSFAAPDSSISAADEVALISLLGGG